jgi:Zn finger protein HypA/HybF involved in hydrogenase expression
MTLFDRLLHREDPPEMKCPKCGTPAPQSAIDCAVCGWDMREVYKGERPEVAEPAG